MEEVKRLNTCSECEHFGDGRFPVVKYFSNGELNSEFVGFSDRPNGNAVENFSRRCEINSKILIYNDTPSCKEFVPKTWVRPFTCGDCTCHKQYYNDYSFFSCANYPFFKYSKNNDKACANGKMQKNKTYTLFDFMK